MGSKTDYRVIAEMPYEPKKVERGYTGRTLYVNIGTGKMESRPVTDQMKQIFDRWPWVRAVAVVERDQRQDELERPGQRNRD